MEAKIDIKGKAYPCRQTMGAMLRFRRETGHEVTQMTSDNISDMAVYLWCCVCSACKADDVAFDMDLMTFLDVLEPEDLMKWSEQVGAEASADEEESSDKQKKSRRKS